ncbi:Pentatricopeptide repeat-containing protein [Acorus calamus]|uniref:Pentatricopeptide repeat-containing protein n=1 Tax=Acorus calamus TaxID=4465 RepID=A0AAV9FJD0_ACOCL|nr:Pentatricopeptide repeat-containing protein [Acorus calamus]
MLRQGSKSNHYTYPLLFKACSALAAIETGDQLHAHVFKLGFHADLYIGNSLIDMYAKCFRAMDARRVFDEMLGRWVSVFVDVNAIPVNVMLSTALIDMHSKCGDVSEARRVFDLVSDKTSLASWNSMITGLGALELGREVHLYLGRSEMDMNMKLATAIVDMYSKCGSIDDAYLVFVKAHEKDVALWNAMIFGLVEQGRYNFKKLVSRYQLRLKIEHYSCMVDLLGRAGCLDEAFELMWKGFEIGGGQGNEEDIRAQLG